MSRTVGRIERTGQVAFHDASLNIWEEGLSAARDARGLNGASAWERQFKRDVFARIVQTLKRIGWTLTMPTSSEHDIKHYGGTVCRWSNESKRLCVKGDLKADLSVSGRCIEFKIFQNVNAPDRPDHDGRYQNNKEAVMPYPLRLEMERTRRRIRDYLCNVFTGYEFKPVEPKCGIAGVTAEQAAAHARKSSGHYVAALDHAKISMTCNYKAADGGTIVHGASVFAIGSKGRIITGTAYYSLNDRWQIVTGRYGLTSASAHEIFTANPGALRVKRNERSRRQRLESELTKATLAMHFERAAVLRDVIFPTKEPVYMIYHKEKHVLFGTNYCGYTNDQATAGKYTREELKPYLHGALETDRFKAVPVGMAG